MGERIERNGVVGGLVKGAIAGAIGVWALDQVTGWMWEHESARTRQLETNARPGGLDPAHVMANRAAEAMGATISPQQPHPAGIAVHYGLGIGPGAAYGVLRKRFRAVGAGGGLLYGLSLFLLQDELANPLLGTSGGPTEYPREAHVRGLVGHLIYGAATNAALDVLDRVA